MIIFHYRMGKQRCSPTTCFLAVLTCLVLTSYTCLFLYHTALITSSQRKYLLTTSELVSRSNRMHRICSDLPAPRQLTLPLHGRLFYTSRVYNLSFCRAANVGSTFWAQIFMELSEVRPGRVKNGEVSSVFDLSRNETHNFMKEHPELTAVFTDKRLRYTNNFLIARNPYSRLFSSYIDQIFLLAKWKQARHMGRKSKYKKCGTNVTFEEFLFAVSKGILLEKETDLHWAPIFSICLPCETKIDILAKYETFNNDIDEILSYVGVRRSLIDSVMKVSVEHNTNIMHTGNLRNLVHFYLTRAHQIPEGCLTEAELARKLWTSFKVQGYLHNEHQFPFDLFKAVHKNHTESVLFNEMVKATEKRKLTLSESFEQRKSWQLKFWKTVSKETVKLVQNAFYEDFIVFDYDMDVDNI